MPWSPPFSPLLGLVFAKMLEKPNQQTCLHFFDLYWAVSIHLVAAWCALADLLGAALQMHASGFVWAHSNAPPLTLSDFLVLSLPAMPKGSEIVLKSVSWNGPYSQSSGVCLRCVQLPYMSSLGNTPSQFQQRDLCDGLKSWKCRRPAMLSPKHWLEAWLFSCVVTSIQLEECLGCWRWSVR